MKFLNFEVKDNTGILTVNRPDALNALNRELLEEMEYFLRVEIMNHSVPVLILTGAGEKAFIAGADIKAMQGMNHLEMMNFSHLGQQVTLLLERMNRVTIAAVNGYALGGGLEMALACDFIYASENARLGLPEVSLGLIPGFGGTQRLARAVGTRLAKEMVFSAKPISAEQAEKIGLVNRVLPQAELLPTVLDIANTISVNSSLAIMEAKQAINSGIEMSMTDALNMEKQIFGVVSASPDKKEGIAAFIEKRKPAFNPHF